MPRSHERGGESGQAVSDALFDIVHREVDEAVRVSGMDDGCGGNNPLGHVVKRGIGTGGYLYVRGTTALDRFYNDVLLEHIVVPKRAVAGLEDMHMTKGHHRQEALAEGLEVGPVAK